LGLGLSFLLVAFAVGVGMVVKNTAGNIKTFKNRWQSELLSGSAKEQMLLAVKNNEAGFSLDENGCNTEITTPFLKNLFGNSNLEIKCSIDGKNNEGITTDQDQILYTVPKANTGDAGLDCSPLHKFTNLEALEAYYGTEGTGQSDPIEYLFGNNPLNHPCNWGKLKFGNSFSSRIVVPLYYAELSASDQVIIKNPGDIGLNQLKIKVRTPCKPIKARIECIDGEDQNGNPIFSQAPECIYPDICKDTDRYILNPGNFTIDQDETIVLWQISGECNVKSTDIFDGTTIKNTTETCAMIPDNEVNEMTGERKENSNSEIYESFINNFSAIDQAKFGKIAYYKHITDQKKTILNFLTYSQDEIFVEEKTYYTSITKPVLQLAMVVNELLSENDKHIPYLEYQIITNVPISNISQQFKTEINYEGQSFLNNYSIDQKKNVVDFALQD